MQDIANALYLFRQATTTGWSQANENVPVDFEETLDEDDLEMWNAIVRAQGELEEALDDFINTHR
jgi:hypothetical protein